MSHLCQLAGRHLLAASRGAIVNISSILGIVGGSPLGPESYSGSKAAVIWLTRELSCQWASGGVRVNALAPGWFESEMTSGLFADERSTAYVVR